MPTDPETGAAILTVTSKTHGMFHVLVDVADWERVNAHVWRVLKPKSNNERVYFRTDIRHPDGKRKTVLLHRFLLNAPSHLEVTHTHHSFCDLRKSELKIVTRKQNQENVWGPIARRTSSRFRGVYWSARSGKWCANIEHHQEPIHIGTFPGTPEGEIEAARAFDRKALELFTHLTNESLNFPIADYQEAKVA